MTQAKESKSKNEATLNAKQQRFVDEYLVDLNASQAATRAGYSPKTGAQHAARLLKNVKVIEAIQTGLIEKQNRTKIDADYVLRQAVKLHERCMQEIEPFTDKKGNQIHDDFGRPVYVFDSKGAASSLNIIGKHVGVQAFREITELTGKNGGPIETTAKVVIVPQKAQAQVEKRQIQRETE